jgi:hypothetical protein
MTTSSRMIALAMAAGLTASLGNSLAPGRGMRVAPNAGVSLLDGNAAPMPPGGWRGSVGKGKGRRPRHPSNRYVAQDKRDALKARSRT